MIPASLSVAKVIAKSLSLPHRILGKSIKALNTYSARAQYRGNHSPAPGDILSRSPLLIDIGGQKNREDRDGRWVIADISSGADMVVDLNSRGLPLSGNSVDFFYTSHTLEHILPEKQSVVFSELYRALKPGGLIRIVVPDTAKAVRAYINRDSSFLRSSDNPAKLGTLPDKDLCYLSGWFFTYREFNVSLLGGHVMAFDDEVLRHYLSESGFMNITKKSFGISHAAFEGKDLKRYKDCSLYYEAAKPGEKG